MSKSALICGASQGIGLGLLTQILSLAEYDVVFATHRASSDLRPLHDLKEKHGSRLSLVEFDALNEKSFEHLANEVSKKTKSLDLCINSIGVLTTDKLFPERKLEEVKTASLLESFQVNSIASLILAQKLKPLLMSVPDSKFVAISAKVGSVQDNKMGGWYSYRISKAALNMAIKNLSIELGRTNKQITVMALHPGTTETQLSKPFIESAKRKYKVHTPDETAENLMKVILAARPETHNGKFWSWDGVELPW